MKQFNLEEYFKNPSRKVVTRDGKSVRIVCTDFNNKSYPIIGEVQGETDPATFTKEGLFSRCCKSSNLDLFFAPEKHEGWINVYKAGITPYSDSCIWPTEEEAKKWANDDYIATVKIEWEE